MQKVYEAQNSLEAHMLCGLLQQSGISGFVQGELLQGGMGELPATGFVTIEVNDMDYDQARAIIKDWESQHQFTPRAESKYFSPFWYFCAGLAVGVLATSLLS